MKNYKIAKKQKKKIVFKLKWEDEEVEEVIVILHKVTQLKRVLYIFENLHTTNNKDFMTVLFNIGW